MLLGRWMVLCASCASAGISCQCAISVSRLDEEWVTLDHKKLINKMMASTLEFDLSVFSGDVLNQSAAPPFLVGRPTPLLHHSLPASSPLPHASFGGNRCKKANLPLATISAASPNDARRGEVAHKHDKQKTIVQFMLYEIWETEDASPAPLMFIFYDRAPDAPFHCGLCPRAIQDAAPCLCTSLALNLGQPCCWSVGWMCSGVRSGDGNESI